MTSDLDGRNRIPLNVLTSWMAQGVQIVSGFVVPRMIDGRLGQDALGVWDLAWSIVTYFALVQGGVTSSINRYVARHRAAGDALAVSRVVSSVTAILVCMGAVVLVLAAVCSLGVSRFLGAQLESLTSQARMLVLILGGSMAMQIALSAFGGLLTGCHRWDLHNGTYAACYLAMLAGMVSVLTLGGGLVGLAVVVFVTEALGKFIRWALAYRVYPGLEVRLKHVSWHTARGLLGFGGKSFIPQVGDIVLNQTISVMLVAQLGPGALALFARPKALVRHVRTLLEKYAYVLVPTASSLQEAGDTAGLRRLLVDACRYGVCICLPVLLLLAVMGGELLRLWMGATYCSPLLMAVLALGHLAFIASFPLYHVLVGLNAHGRVGAVGFVANMVALACCWCALFVFDAGLLGVALAMGLCLSVTHGIYYPFAACRRLGVPVWRFVWLVWRTPVLCAVPYLLCLLAAHFGLGEDHPLLALAAGGGAGGLLLAAAYWRFIVPVEWRVRVARRLGRIPRRGVVL